jgi:hypothetical protein
MPRGELAPGETSAPHGLGLFGSMPGKRTSDDDDLAGDPWTGLSNLVDWWDRLGAGELVAHGLKAALGGIRHCVMVCLKGECNGCGCMCSMDTCMTHRVGLVYTLACAHSNDQIKTTD